MEQVFRMNLRAGPGNSLEEKFRRLLRLAGMPGIVGANELVAIKVHVGERGNLAFIHHAYAGVIVDEIKSAGGKSFLTDTNTLYSGGRHNAVDHHQTAGKHGYFSGTTGAPFIVADGLRGLDFKELAVNGRHIKTARIASGLCGADALVMMSHFKGHGEMGFGGTLKNMGMGCAAIPGKLELHSDTMPVQHAEKCTGCGQCVRSCPVNAIALKNKKAVIDPAACIGCGQCVAACSFNAMNVQWAEHGERLIEKVAEYAAALQKRFAGKALYCNFAMNITPDCDCWDYNEEQLVQDAGIFASTAPLALDKATFDMVTRGSRLLGGRFAGVAAAQGNFFDAVHPGVKSEYLFEYCKKLGFDDEYRLVEVS